MATKATFGIAAVALLFLTALAPAADAQGTALTAPEAPAAPSASVGDVCRWWEASLVVVPDAYGGLFLPIDLVGTTALVQVAPSGASDAGAGASEACLGGALRDCTAPAAGQGLAILIGWIGCYELDDGPLAPDGRAEECPLDKLLGGLESFMAGVPCLEDVEVPDPDLCKPATDCLPDPCGSTLGAVDPARAADTDCLPCQPAASCIPDNPCDPASACIPDLCGSTQAVVDPSRAAGTDCLPCQPAASCIPDNPCQPASECIPPTCPLLDIIPGQCGSPPLSTDPCDYLGPMPNARTNLPCGGSIEECDYLGAIPGFCGRPLPPTDPCYYLGPSMPNARTNLPCGGSVDECDYLQLVPGQCGSPPFDPCQSLVNLQANAAGGAAGGDDVVVEGPCGPITLPGYCRVLGSTPGFCGIDPVDPCESINLLQANSNDVGGGEDVIVDGPCGPITVPGYCRVLGSTPGFCGMEPLDPCDPLVTFNTNIPGDGFVVDGPCGPIPVPGACDVAPTAPFVCVPGPDPCVRPKGGECYTLRGILYAILQVGYQLDEDLDRMGDEWERRVVGTVDYLVDWALDLDHDGLKNVDEFRWDTHPLDPDTDDDGWQDGPEATYWDRTPDQAVTVESGVALHDADSKTDTDGDGTPNILDPDSDDDHLLDGEEQNEPSVPHFGTYPEFPDSDLQGTGDGLTDYQEVRDRDDDPATGTDGGFGTLPLDEDSDDDVVLDGDEAARWGSEWNTEFDCSPGSNNLRDADADGDTVKDGAEWDQYAIDPRSVDSDGDVMDDGYEVLKGFVPSNGADGSNDVDGDGLGSAFEYAFERSGSYQVCALGPYLWGLDPHVADMDGDTLTDGAEIDGRHNAYSSPSHYDAYPKSTDVQSSDSDFDGLSDSQEMLALGTNPNDSDTDGDGLADGNEAAFGTSPTDPDSDNDGLNDGGEQRAGTNPNLGDSDGDGAQDGSDSNPRQENIPPSYPGGPSAYVVFREDGYIDVIIEEPNSEEANVAGVQLSGTLTANGPSGSLPSLSFNMEATRGDDGIWGARVGIPPGVTSVTHESIRLLVVDNNGIGWATTGSFGNTLAGPAWQTSPTTVRDANDWQTLIEHQSPANTDPPTTGMSTATLVPGPDGTTLYDPAGPLGALSIYRVDPAAFAPLQFVETQFGVQGVAIAENGFDWVDPSLEPDLYEQTAFGFKWKAPRFLYTGIQGGVKEFLNSAYKTTESALRETQYQAASFILGADHPAAHGRSAGDFVGGFLLWGDFRDCIIRPAYIDPQSDAEKIINAAITALSCTGLAVDLAQATPGAPAAVAANAAMTLIKLALKKLVRIAAELGVHLVDMIGICAKNLDTCLPIGTIAKVAKDDDVARTGLKELIDAVGAEDLARFEKRFPDHSGRLANLQKDFVTRGVPDYTLVMRRSHVELNGWDADTTLSKILTKYDMALKTDAARAPQFLADVSKIIEKSAQGKIPPAQVQNFIQFGTKEGENVVQGALKKGDFLEARYATEQLEQGKSIDTFAKSYTQQDADFWKNGKYSHTSKVDGEHDVLLNSPSGKVRVEVKDKASLDGGDFTQIEKQLAHQKKNLGAGGHANEYHLVLGSLERDALPTALSKVKALAEGYKINVKVFDRVTGIMHSYGP